MADVGGRVTNSCDFHREGLDILKMSRQESSNHSTPSIMVLSESEPQKPGLKLRTHGTRSAEGTAAGVSGMGSQGRENAAAGTEEPTAAATADTAGAAAGSCGLKQITPLKDNEVVEGQPTVSTLAGTLTGSELGTASDRGVDHSEEAAKKLNEHEKANNPEQVMAHPAAAEAPQAGKTKGLLGGAAERIGHWSTVRMLGGVGRRRRDRSPLRERARSSSRGPVGLGAGVEAGQMNGGKGRGQRARSLSKIRCSEPRPCSSSFSSLDDTDDDGDKRAGLSARNGVSRRARPSERGDRPGQSRAGEESGARESAPEAGRRSGLEGDARGGGENGEEHPEDSDDDSGDEDVLLRPRKRSQSTRFVGLAQEVAAGRRVSSRGRASLSEARLPLDMQPNNSRTSRGKVTFEGVRTVVAAAAAEAAANGSPRQNGRGRMGTGPRDAGPGGATEPRHQSQERSSMRNSRRQGAERQRTGSTRAGSVATDASKTSPLRKERHHQGGGPSRDALRTNPGEPTRGELPKVSHSSASWDRSRRRLSRDLRAEILGIEDVEFRMVDDPQEARTDRARPERPMTDAEDAEDSAPARGLESHTSRLQRDSSRVRERAARRERKRNGGAERRSASRAKGKRGSDSEIPSGPGDSSEGAAEVGRAHAGPSRRDNGAGSNGAPGAPRRREHGRRGDGGRENGPRSKSVQVGAATKLPHVHADGDEGSRGLPRDVRGETNGSSTGLPVAKEVTATGGDVAEGRAADSGAPSTAFGRNGARTDAARGERQRRVSGKKVHVGRASESAASPDSCLDVWKSADSPHRACETLSTRVASLSLRAWTLIAMNLDVLQAAVCSSVLPGSPDPVRLSRRERNGVFLLSSPVLPNSVSDLGVPAVPHSLPYPALSVHHAGIADRFNDVQLRSTARCWRLRRGNQGRHSTRTGEGAGMDALGSCACLLPCSRANLPSPPPSCQPCS